MTVGIGSSGTFRPTKALRIDGRRSFASPVDPPRRPPTAPPLAPGWSLRYPLLHNRGLEQLLANERVACDNVLGLIDRGRLERDQATRTVGEGATEVATSAAHPIAQVKHPVTLNHDVRILQQVLRVD